MGICTIKKDKRKKEVNRLRREIRYRLLEIAHHSLAETFRIVIKPPFRIVIKQPFRIVIKQPFVNLRPEKQQLCLKLNFVAKNLKVYGC